MAKGRRHVIHEAVVDAIASGVEVHGPTAVGLILLVVPILAVGTVGSLLFGTPGGMAASATAAQLAWSMERRRGGRRARGR